MNKNLAMLAADAAQTILQYFSTQQFNCMVELSRGEEGAFFLQKFIDLAEQIKTMPETYDQEGLGDEAVVHLHYFLGADSHWYITERDAEDGIYQSYGYAVLNGDDEMAESGYISIEEITRYGAELDLHFTPCRLVEIKGRRAQRAA